MSKRRQNFENIAWFLDLYKRSMLDLDPPFQRRSVWNQRYREDFIDTVLLDYPAPAIFLFASISESGVTNYQLVDGKQRLMAIFDFVAGEYPVGEQSPLDRIRGTYFDDLDKERKLGFYQYDFSVEYLPTNNEQVINTIFDRLNRNVAKLTPQELRHARFSGRFITQCETLQEWMEAKLHRQFPRITESSRRQMKDIEVVAMLLLFLEDGVKGYSTLALDQAFSDRDEEWELETAVVDEFRFTVEAISRLIRHPEGTVLVQSRLRNQADFYSLFAAITELTRAGTMPSDEHAVICCLKEFVQVLEDDDKRLVSKDATGYYDAARSASNDPGPRRIRIDIMKRVIVGEKV